MDRDDDPCKLFVGGLTRSTTTEMLHQYFQKFGELTDCVVIKNPTTKLSRCFGFVQFTTPQIADHVVESRPHIIDGKEIDVKHASAESHERHQQQLAAAAAAVQALNAAPVLDPPGALLDAPQANNIDPNTLAILCLNPMNNAGLPQTAAPGFVFDGPSFGIGIGGVFGLALILGTSVSIIRKSRISADTQGRVAGDFGVKT